MQQVRNIFPLFLDARGDLLDGGNIFVGEAGADPQVNPITVYADQALTTPLSQPIRTVGGFAVNENANPTFMFVAQSDYCQRVTDSSGSLVAYAPSTFVDSDSFQPRSTALDALVNNGTPTDYGLSLLRLGNYSQFKAANSIPDYLALTGGTMSGQTTHQGAGVEPYWSDPAMISGKMYYTDAAGADPTTAVGEIWFKGVA
ncbi:hypothetical protein FPZ24_08115 [Sphingomonas panacisoli]|uniref:Uncharacterized protein n=1 Tax=Sphingomonas panacisoli TaxID=1813879 RepID=A0A5B8LGN0_9SPHN|nr:hypothetical protein [Sphingomonas panacisoli]QDZ07448.1 hypothetical protein FPZ24_08115 [Sphingomonas panacisoli]